MSASRALMYSSAAEKFQAPQYSQSGAMMGPYYGGQQIPQSQSSTILQSFVSPTGLIVVAVIGGAIFLWFKGGALWDWLKEVLLYPFKKFGEFGKDAIDQIKEGSQKALDAVKDAGTKTIDGIKDIGNKTIDAVSSTGEKVSQGVETVEDKIGDIGNKAKDAGILNKTGQFFKDTSKIVYSNTLKKLKFW
jgi:gas vesicle protein